MQGTLQVSRKRRRSTSYKRRCKKFFEGTEALFQSIESVFQATVIESVLVVLGSSLMNPKEVYCLRCAHDPRHPNWPSVEQRHAKMQLIRKLVETIGSADLKDVGPSSLRVLLSSKEAGDPSVMGNFFPNQRLKIRLKKSLPIAIHVGNQDALASMNFEDLSFVMQSKPSETSPSGTPLVSENKLGSSGTRESSGVFWYQYKGVIKGIVQPKHG